MNKALIVVGSAPCWAADYAQAKVFYPNSETLLINGACTLLKDAEHMLAGHTAKAEEFVAARKRAFPNDPLPKVHANTLLRNARQYARQYPSVTNWWGPEMSSGATSAGKAALIGIAMGYYPVVLCGCPLDGSGYDPRDAVVKHDASCARVGDPTKQDRRMIKSYKEKMIALAKTEFKGKVFSMSGLTRQHLGAPPEEWLC